MKVKRRQISVGRRRRRRKRRRKKRRLPTSREARGVRVERGHAVAIVKKSSSDIDAKERAHFLGDASGNIWYRAQSWIHDMRQAEESKKITNTLRSKNYTTIIEVLLIRFKSTYLIAGSSSTTLSMIDFIADRYDDPSRARLRRRQ